ncbi:MAG: PaREP1 family protein [Candidatus Njordarchaeales archaeon]
MSESYDEFIRRGWDDYSKALELLETGDFYDAAEKAWSAIENFRKAALIAMKIPHDVARSVREGVPIFSRVLEILGYDTLTKMYFYFNSRLHTLGFYEKVIPEDDIARIIRKEVREWLKKMEKLLDLLKRIDLSSIIELLKELDKARQEALKASMKYAEIKSRILETITRELQSIT